MKPQSKHTVLPLLALFGTLFCTSYITAETEDEATRVYHTGGSTSHTTSGQISSGLSNFGVSATNITAGTLPAGVTLPATQVSAGTFVAGVTLPATRVSAGTFVAGVTLPATQVSAGTFVSGVTLPATQVSAGTFVSGVTLPISSIYGAYGSFGAGAVAVTNGNPIIFTISNTSLNVTLASTSRVTVTNAGTYVITYAVNTAEADFNKWSLKKNGSTTLCSDNIATITAVLAANDYVELVATANNTPTNSSISIVRVL